MFGEVRPVCFVVVGVGSSILYQSKVGLSVVGSQYVWVCGPS